MAFKKLLGFLAIIFLASCISVLLLSKDILSELETRSWDWRLKAIAKQSAPDPSIKIVMIDQTSIEKLSEEEHLNWPWPRELYVPIIEYLQKAQAKGLAFDIVFTEQSFYGLSDDQHFAESLKGSMPVVMAVAMRIGKETTNPERQPLFVPRQNSIIKAASRLQGLLQSKSIPEFSYITLPIPALLQTAHSFGNVAVPNDSDGVFRHALSAGKADGVSVLSLPFALLEASGASWNPHLNRLNSKGEYAVRFAGPARTYKTYSFYSILRSYQAITEGKEPIVPLSEFEDSYVLMGMDAPGLLDLRPTPLSQSFPGVEYHATVLDNALHNAFIKEASFFENLLFSVLFAIIGAIALFIQRPLRQAIVVIVCVSLLIEATFFAAHYGHWLQLMPPLTTTLFAILAALALQYQLEGHHSRFLKNAFKYYVNTEVIDKIIADPTALSLGGDRRELTLFFCDIVGFTGISESMDAQHLGHFLNFFLTEMSKVLLAHKGTIDKYVGDAIVAFWNAPVPVPNHPVLAVKAAIECQKRLFELRGRFKSTYQSEVRLRIGLHTGIISVGNFGSQERFNYTVIGDAANLASRLEGVNKYFGTDILVSGDTYDRVKSEIPCRKIATVKVLGREESVAIYEPIRDKDLKEIDLWNRALSAFEGGDRIAARALFSILPDSKLKFVYLEALNLYKEDVPWSSVITLYEK